ncbi:hypothetical protein JMJ35_008248 [Cladonia borealis]|uniref:Uncharacterized protein n=1 Tax=Cladonia borealis TaxID=184061 RepID=A0AA39QTD3_9LECA|nr:hypothetical protein JMJ35_008248 [Cladonia borealis]
MFDDFSFLSPSRQRAYYSSCQMEDSISPSSSRESSPCYENGYSGSRRYSTSNSIAELSRHFNQHTLSPRRPSTVLEDSTPRARDTNPYLQSPNSFSNRVCRRRQSINRLQCCSGHLSRISTLVEGMLQTGESHYDSSTFDDSTSPSLSPDEHEPTSDSYMGFTPLPASATGIGAGSPTSPQHSLRHSHSYKIDKELRHSASRDGLGKPMVKKKIRMRRSSKSLPKGPNKRCER